MKFSFRRFFAVSALLVFIGMAVVGVRTGLKVKQYIHAFEQSAGTSALEIKRQIISNWKISVEQTNDTITALILGTDQLKGRPTHNSQANVLTDSLILTSLNLKTLALTQVSLPRDLWIDQYRTKINALYFYGYEKTPQDPTAFPKSVIQDITGVPIQYVVVLNLNTVAKVIDALGGVDVQIDRSFTDEQFPKPGVDVATVRDPKLLYETVQFSQGNERMNGERALVFIRSRRSKDRIEGTDEGRIMRQQKVMLAMMSKAMNPAILKNPTVLGKLYALYRSEFSSAIPFDQVIAIGKYVGQQLMNNKKNMTALQIKKATISIQEYGQKGTLFHPDVKKYGGQWVYIPVDSTWNGLRDEIRGFYANE